MKRKIALLLTLAAILTICLSGCSTERRRIEFRQNVQKLAEETNLNITVISVLLSYETVYMDTHDVKDRLHAEDTVEYATKMYDNTIQELKRQGNDTRTVTIEAIGDRIKTIEDLFSKIDEDMSSRELEPDLYANAAKIYLDHSLLIGMMTQPYGPFNDFEQQYRSLCDQAGKAYSAIVSEFSDQ